MDKRHIKLLRVLLGREPSEMEKRINFAGWSDRPHIFDELWEKHIKQEAQRRGCKPKLQESA